MFFIAKKRVLDGESEYTENYLVIAKSNNEAWRKAWEHLKSDAIDKHDVVNEENMSVGFNGDTRIETIHAIHQVDTLADLEKILYTIR